MVVHNKRKGNCLEDNIYVIFIHNKKGKRKGKPSKNQTMSLYSLQEPHTAKLHTKTLPFTLCRQNKRTKFTELVT